MAERAQARSAGMDPNPLADERLRGGPGPQHQEWPGREADLRPPADHGEETYVGSGKLAGGVALITGGDSGIGRAVAIAFAREGADVAIGYYDEHDDARETGRWVRAAGRRFLAFAGDVADRAHCRELVRRTVDELGRLDILVNNAAFQRGAEELAALAPEQLERTFRTNVFACFWLAEAALEHMGPGSVILNTGSVTALEGSPGLLDYSAAKGAVHVFTKSLARALAPRGIRVNCVAPGPVWTPLIPASSPAEQVAGFGADTVWGRPAQPAEIAPFFVFLASAESRYCTGEIIAPTGRVDATTR